jgi:periplasmic protein TonB
MTKSALVALVIEALVIAALLLIAAKKPAKAETPEPAVMLSFPEPVKPETLPEKKVEPVKPQQHKAPQAKPREQPEPEPKIVEPAPVAEAAPVTLPVKPVEPPRHAPPATVSDSFKGEVKAAVQAAMVYPASARMAHVTGKAKVAFNYQDGRVDNPRVVVSSGSSMLDAAARRAVEAAAYPAPPAGFAGKPLQFEVWVRFFLGGLAED